MSGDQIGDLLNKAILTIFAISAPVLFVGLAIGFFVSIFQAATQINEVTLVFIPKMMGAGLVLWYSGGWIVEQLMTFTLEVETVVQSIAQGGAL
ncbi:MAG: flagellar biosynthetic protein FliQ [Myxococcota bacterium]|jgi:flagellar biosynthetic protein FliQ